MFLQEGLGRHQPDSVSYLRREIFREMETFIACQFGVYIFIQLQSLLTNFASVKMRIDVTFCKFVLSVKNLLQFFVCQMLRSHKSSVLNFDKSFSLSNLRALKR